MSEHDEAPDRTLFVSYDVTDRSIVLQFVGEDPHKITPDEALALRADLLAASVAAHEHSMLRET